MQKYSVNSVSFSEYFWVYLHVEAKYFRTYLDCSTKKQDELKVNLLLFVFTKAERGLDNILNLLYSVFIIIHIVSKYSSSSCCSFWPIGVHTDVTYIVFLSWVLTFIKNVGSGYLHEDIITMNPLLREPHGSKGKGTIFYVLSITWEFSLFFLLHRVH